MNKNIFDMNVDSLQADMYKRLKNRFLQTELNTENYKWVSDLAFICSCEPEINLPWSPENIQEDIIHSLEIASDDTAACYLLSLCEIACAMDMPQLCAGYKNRYAFKIKESDVPALWIDAIGTAAVLCSDGHLTDICIEKSHDLIEKYTRCIKHISLPTVLDEMSYIAHFNSFCMMNGYDKDKLDYSFYSKLVKWYTQSLYNEKELKWFQSENAGIYPNGDMLIHIASLPDSPYHTWLNRFKVLARYLFDRINLPNECYGRYSVLNINNAAEKCSPFEASLANLDVFWNNEIIITDDQHEPKLKVYISPAGLIKVAYKGKIVYMHHIIPYNSVKYADILNGQQYVVCTECSDKEVCIYTIDIENASIWIEHKISNEMTKKEKFEFTADISDKIQALKEGS